MTDLKNKVVIVTGSTSGIGEAIARMLSKSGVRVVINSIASVDKGNALVKELNSIYCQADIGNEEDCKKLIETTVNTYGKLDFLINNAGAPRRLPTGNLEDITNDIFSTTLNLNVVGTWCLTRYAIPHLKKSSD